MAAPMKLNEPIVISDSGLENDRHNDDFNTYVPVYGQEPRFVGSEHQEPQLLPRGMGNLGGKVDGNGAKSKDKCIDIVTADGSEDGKEVDIEVEPSSAEQGCVVGPHVEGASVWIVGHSFIRWAAKQADLRPLGRQVGFDGSRVKVS
ncbi:hypothetical protein NDU88_003944 [Pleurodeles waltl]|uniref:Uncharacterized protein n=1 Tax=Pleurodeles waltl TaxID=8319 RepID=A0AAV7TQ40_PLEWA|nr:hypothetical protein NDU88_003944 [Pleurodeles waltl]